MQVLLHVCKLVAGFGRYGQLHTQRNRPVIGKFIQLHAAAELPAAAGGAGRNQPVISINRKGQFI